MFEDLLVNEKTDDSGLKSKKITLKNRNIQIIVKSTNIDFDGKDKTK